MKLLSDHRSRPGWRGVGENSLQSHENSTIADESRVKEMRHCEARGCDCAQGRCISRESNPGRPRGGWAFYHWTTGVLVGCDLLDAVSQTLIIFSQNICNGSLFLCAFSIYANERHILVISIRSAFHILFCSVTTPMWTKVRGMIPQKARTHT